MTHKLNKNKSLKRNNGLKFLQIRDRKLQEKMQDTLKTYSECLSVSKNVLIYDRIRVTAIWSQEGSAMKCWLEQWLLPGAVRCAASVPALFPRCRCGSWHSRAGGGRLETGGSRATWPGVHSAATETPRHASARCQERAVPAVHMSPVAPVLPLPRSNSVFKDVGERKICNDKEFRRKLNISET